MAVETREQSPAPHIHVHPQDAFRRTTRNRQGPRTATGWATSTARDFGLRRNAARLAFYGDVHVYGGLGFALWSLPPDLWCCSGLLLCHGCFAAVLCSFGFGAPSSPLPLPGSAVSGRGWGVWFLVVLQNKK